MTALTLHLELTNFEIKTTHESPHKIIACGMTTESQITCRECGEVTNRFHGLDQQREVRHLSACGKNLYLQYCPRRYVCLHCGPNDLTTTATPEFHYPKSQFTYELEKRLLLELVNSTLTDVSKKYEVTEDEVQGIVDRHISGSVEWSRFKALGVIGIDEIAIKKGRGDYITIVTALIEGKVHIIGVILGRKKKDIHRFLKSIPVQLRKTVVAVCVDMYVGYVNAAKDVFKNAAIIIDRYHVAKLYRKSLDKFRKDIIAELKRHMSADEYEEIKHVTNILRSNKIFFSEEEKAKLDAVFSHSFELAEAYRLVRALTHVFNGHLTVEEGLAKFADWISDVRRSKLTFLKTFVKTLTKFKQEIANYFIDRQTSGFVEGFNNKLKVMKRRCYGIFNLKHLFQRLTLDTAGYELYAINKEV